jgi:hypothetical protein
LKNTNPTRKACISNKTILGEEHTKHYYYYYRGADNSLARPGRKQATPTEYFDVHISYLLSSLEEY